MCGKLNFWLYGFRPAAAEWEQLYASKLEEVGFVRGLSCGVVFYHEGRDISLAVHGDDFTFCGGGNRSSLDQGIVVEMVRDQSQRHVGS